MSAERAFSVRRSKRARHARLTVTRDGEAVVVLPMRAPERAAALLVEAHGPWLDRQVERLRSRCAALERRPSLVEGRFLAINGRTRLVVARDAPEQAAVARALRAEARALLLERVEVLSRAVGVRPGRVTVRGQRARWGSASRAGSVSLNWRLILAPPEVLDYVVVHELVHRLGPGHTRRFWSTVRRHAPDTDTSRRWLRDNHAELMAALD